MWTTMLLPLALFVLQLTTKVTADVCGAAGIATCAPHVCVQTDVVFSCLCPDMSLSPNAAGCGAVVVTTLPPVLPPNQCGLVACPFGATCIPTNQNPSQYVCVCPNNIIANPDCPVNPLPNNPCVYNNPCQNGGTCVVNQLTLQAVCICPANTYGNNCGLSCLPRCASNWCYNGGRCVDGYGQAYCSCPHYLRGRRCELRYNPYNYVYLYQLPYYGK